MSNVAKGKKRRSKSSLFANVTFADYDGTVISTQSVKYGGAATPPSAPARKVYTFSRWSGSYSSVRSNSTVTAVYSPIPYSIKFVDESGNTLRTETVNYGSSVSDVPTAPSKTGYTFVAWSVKSGEGNSYTDVNGNAVFEPTYAWSNPDMPLAVSVKKALRDDSATKYTITVQMANNTSNAVDCKLITVIKTANDKVVATKIEKDVTVAANALAQSLTVTINSSNDGSVCEAYLVANDSENNDRTGGALSDKSSVAVTSESTTTSSAWGSWSDWSTSQYSSSSTRQVESKIQYSYSDKSTTSSTSSSLSGWTLYNQSTWVSGYGNWSDWSGTAVSANSSTDVQTAALYRYYYYKCNSCGGRNPYASGTCLGCKKSTSKTWVCMWTTLRYQDSTYYNYDSKKSYTCNYDNGLRWYFSGGTRSSGGNKYSTAIGTIDADSSAVVIKQGYRSRAIYYTTTYYYYKWGSWSSWSDSAYYSSDTRQVQTRTIYRYRDLYTTTSTSSAVFEGAEDTSGTSYNVSGKLTNVSDDYSGKSATVMVYKDKNIDPTEDQMEYIGQITIGTGNTYDFSFIPKEEISTETGNYIVSFGIATADGLVNNEEIIEAPKPTYNVVFRDDMGNILSQQEVEQYSDAVAPELPAKDGYTYTWDRTFTTITNNTIITAVPVEKTYNVIFVDWANDKIVSVNEQEYGEEIEFPADCSAVGKNFIGWSVPEGSTVSGTTIVEAVYEDISYTVTFLNKDGSVFATGSANYGKAAALPEENPTAEGYEFISWDNNDSWWNVTSDITVSPIFIYDSTVETPVVTSDDLNYMGAAVEMDTSTEDAVIRYTTDGSEPTEEDLIFDEPIWIEETTTFRVKAFKMDMNGSETAEVTIEVVSEDNMPSVKVLTDNSRYEIGKDYAKLPVKIENPYGLVIESYGYTIVNTSTEEVSDYENTSVAGSTDTLIGKLFTVNGLDEATTYTYLFFVNFEGLTVYSNASSGQYTDEIVDPDDITPDQFTTLGEASSAYTVEHYVMDTDGAYPSVPTSAESKTEKPSNSITVADLKLSSLEVENGIAYSYAQVNGTTVSSVNIASDGSTVIKLYYARSKYDLTLNKDTGITSVTGAGSYYYGQDVTINAEIPGNYNWICWKNGSDSFVAAQNYTFTMPANALTLTASADEDISYTSEYKWSEDFSACVATATSEKGGSPITENATVTGKVTVPATCTTAGTTEYTAVFTNGLFAAQTKTVDNIPATGHISAEAVQENVVLPDGTTKGSYDEVIYCSVCKEELSRVTKVIPAGFISASCDKAAILRGQTATFTVITSTSVMWLRFNGSYTTAAGNTKNVSTYYSSANWSSDADGVRTWTNPVTLSYTVSDASITETWKIDYKLSGSSKWNTAMTASGAWSSSVDIYRNAESMPKADASEELAPYSIISVEADKTSASAGDKVIFTVKTTSDVTKVRIGHNYTVDGAEKTKAVTYQTTSSNQTHVDNGDGTMTWTITYKVPSTASGETDFNVQVRGTAWSTAQSKTITVA